MFYKRISDLHPLGKPNGTDWSDLKPIQIDDSTTEERLSVVLDEPSTVNYKIPSQKISHPASNNINESVLPHLKPEFAKDFWWETSSETTDMISGKIIESTITNPQEISANNFLKSLWIETAIAKNKDNKPTSRKNKISKYQSKRMNAYNFLNFSPFDVDVSEVHAQCIIAKSANSSGNLTANVIFSDIAKLENVFSKYCELSSLSVNSISSNALSATIGAFDSLSGGDGYYNKTQFNVLSSTEICAQNAHITNIQSTELSSASGSFTNITTSNITVDSVSKIRNMYINHGGVAEVFDSIRNYMSGRLVSFGGDSNREIILADNSHPVNGVITELPGPYSELSTLIPGILLNSKSITIDDFKANRLVKCPQNSSDRVFWSNYVYTWEYANALSSVSASYPSYTSETSKPSWINTNYSTLRKTKWASVKKAVMLAGTTPIVIVPPAYGNERLYLCKKYDGAACSFSGAVYEACNFENVNVTVNNVTKTVSEWFSYISSMDLSNETRRNIVHEISISFEQFCYQKMFQPDPSDIVNIGTMLNVSENNGKIIVTDKPIGIQNYNGTEDEHGHNFPWISFKNPNYRYIKLKHGSNVPQLKGIFSQALVQLNIEN